MFNNKSQDAAAVRQELGMPGGNCGCILGIRTEKHWEGIRRRRSQMPKEAAAKWRRHKRICG